MPSPNNTQQITEALAKVTQLQRLPEAVPDVLCLMEKKKTRQDSSYGKQPLMPS